MKNRRVGVALALITSLVASACSEQEGVRLKCLDSKPAMLEQGEVATAKVLALSGSAEPAFSLAHYYSDRNKREEAKYWVQIAAENGHVAAMRSFAYLLDEGGNKEEKIRAEFWISQANRCGPKPVPALSHSS